MQEQLGCPVGETYDGDLIYKFADDYRELSAESFVDKSYFDSTEQDENYIDL